MDNGSTLTTYDCAVFVYRNQSSVPSAPDYESVQCSLSINEFGLYDVTYHCRTFVSKEESSNSSKSEGGMAYDKKRTVRKYYQKKDGKTYYRDFTATYSCFWGGGAEWLAKQLMQREAKDYPELGLVSGMRGGIMTVFTHIQPGNEQGPLSERAT